jgi:hypothetical protein
MKAFYHHKKNQDHQRRQSAALWALPTPGEVALYGVS